MKKILFIFGTRPEAIKMAPLILESQKDKDHFQTIICTTGQHKEMLRSVLDYFAIEPDYELNLMQHDQTLASFSSVCIAELDKVLKDVSPDLVFVQGDTTTAFIGALSGYYRQIPVAHLEAGLRSYDKYSPFPEEINRKLIGSIAELHFAPTETAKKGLEKEQIKDHVYVVGNTVIDALLITMQKIASEDHDRAFSFIDPSKKMILVTGHRRESFGQPFREICEALLKIAEDFPDIQIVYPVHLNPKVQEPVRNLLSGNPRIHLIEPVNYAQMVWLLNKCYFVLTDSGGIQEEAPSLGKPVLVMRNVTERTEGIEAGTAKLVGNRKDEIVNRVAELLTEPLLYNKMSNAINPYGDGKSSAKIMQILKTYFYG